MIVKPCPLCGRVDAACGCHPMHETECRTCGATVLGTAPRPNCHECTPGVPLGSL